jgi:type I restriction enzyme, S subunit
MDNYCPDGWKLVKLSDLGEVNRGKSRHRPRHAPFLYGGPYPFIQTGDIKASGGYITKFSQTYSEAGLAQSRLWPAGTMCITIAANIAETGILKFPACFPDSVIGFIGDEKKCNTRFIEYMFRYLKRHIQHEASESGTVQDNINLGYLEKMLFPIPMQVSEQCAIARILGALDDKIELNRQMNRTLEAMAQAIFKSWFVDFDPVIAKAEGRKPYGMSDEVASLFPAGLSLSEGELSPLGWEKGSILEYATLLSGGTPRTSEEGYWNGGIPWVSAKDVSNAEGVFLLSTERTISHLGVQKSNAKLLPQYTTVITARGTVGSHCMLGKDMTINQTNYGLKARDSYGDFFVFFSVRSMVDQFHQSSYGTIFDTITTKTFQEVRTVLPPQKIIACFEHLASPFMNMISANMHQCNTLRNTRDTLLPKLLTGEIRVKQAEKLAEQHL